MRTLLLDAFRAVVRALATRLLDWAAPPPAPIPLRIVGVGPCTSLSSPPFRGAHGYMCTRSAGHLGAHAAIADNGDRIYSWAEDAS